MTSSARIGRWAIQTATTQDELEAFLSVRNTVYARDPLGLGQELRVLAVGGSRRCSSTSPQDGDRPVGAAFTGLLFQKPDVFAHAWVLAGERRRGIGTGLYETISAYAASRGQDTLEVWGSRITTRTGPPSSRSAASAKSVVRARCLARPDEDRTADVEPPEGVRSSHGRSDRSWSAGSTRSRSRPSPTSPAAKTIRSSRSRTGSRTTCKDPATVRMRRSWRWPATR